MNLLPDQIVLIENTVKSVKKVISNYRLTNADYAKKISDYWHDLLFVKVLEANNFLLHPEGIAVSLHECEELAHEEGFESKWDLALSYSKNILPVFSKQSSDIHSNEKIYLQSILDGLTNEIFETEDILAWFYSANDSSIFSSAIYTRELIIENTLGLWWKCKNPESHRLFKLKYLSFENLDSCKLLPGKAREIKVLDPFIGAGFLIVSFFKPLVAIRKEEENLSDNDAIDSVIKENLYGFDISETAINYAIFNLSLTAWKISGEYRKLPQFNFYCTAYKPNLELNKWLSFIDLETEEYHKVKIENTIKSLYELFSQANNLGSLLNPEKLNQGGNVFLSSYEEIKSILQKIQPLEKNAVSLLGEKFHFVVSDLSDNLSYKENTCLKDFCNLFYPKEKNDLSKVIITRLLEFLVSDGISSFITTDAWLLANSYKSSRKNILSRKKILSLIKNSINNSILISFANTKATSKDFFYGYAVSVNQITNQASNISKPYDINQLSQLRNTDSKIIFENSESKEFLGFFVDIHQGITLNDSMRYERFFWEIERVNKSQLMHSNIKETKLFSGRSNILLNTTTNNQVIIKGQDAIGKKGVLIKNHSEFSRTLYYGEKFSSNCFAIIPKNSELLSSIWCFCESEKFISELKKIEQKNSLSTSILLKIPFESKFWKEKAEQMFQPEQLKEYTDDPVQWSFHGHPLKSMYPLQTTICRLLGYKWIPEIKNMPNISENTIKLISEISEFDKLLIENGIVCIPSINSEPSACERVRDYLKLIFKENWQLDTVSSLLDLECSKSKNLEDYLRNDFFTFHCKIFQHRPFIWQIWDGHENGFSVLINYHKFTKENLQKLIYTYLSNWILLCEENVKNNITEGKSKLLAANNLKKKLEMILTGEKPYDIFVRWKDLKQQAIGWEPDLNDGVKLNLRPFVLAGVLRKNPVHKWGVDRGKNQANSYWGEKRDNSLHLTINQKIKALDNQYED